MRVAKWWGAESPATWDAMDPVSRTEITLLYAAEQGMERIEQAEERKRQRAAQRKRGRRR